MRIEAIVANTSPLITLLRSGQADLLSRLFSPIIVPGAVWRDVTVAEWDDAAARDLGAQTGEPR